MSLPISAVRILRLFVLPLAAALCGCDLTGDYETRIQEAATNIPAPVAKPGGDAANVPALMAEDWKPFTSERFKFSAAFPAVPEESVVPIQEKEMTANGNWFTYEVKNVRAFTFHVTEFTQLPPGVDLTKPELARKFCEVSIQGMPQRLKLNPISENWIQTDGKDGKEIIAQGANATYLFRSYVFNGKDHSIFAYSPHKEELDHFASTLHFLP